MADKSTTMILGAWAGRRRPPAARRCSPAAAAAGLFPTTAAGRQAAQRCKDEGWLRPLAAVDDAPPSLNGSGDTAVLVRKKIKTTPEICVLTEKGLTWLLGQTSPRQVLEDFVRALEARQAQAAEMLAGAATDAGRLRRPQGRRRNGAGPAAAAGRRGRAGRKPDGSFPAFPSASRRPTNRAPALLLSAPDRMASIRRLGRLSAAGAVPPGADRFARPDGRRLPRRACAACTTPAKSTCTRGPARCTPCRSRRSPCSSATRSRITPASEVTR